MNSVVARLQAEVAAGRLDFDPRPARGGAAARSIERGAAPAVLLAQRLRACCRGLLSRAQARATRPVHLGRRGPRQNPVDGLVLRDRCRAAPSAAISIASCARCMRSSASQRPIWPARAVAQRLAARTRVVCLDEFFVADIADAMILAGLFEGLFRRGVMLGRDLQSGAGRALQGRSAAAALLAGDRVAQAASGRRAPGRRHRLSAAPARAGAHLPRLARAGKPR
jgi:hypothetical protein